MAADGPQEPVADPAGLELEELFSTEDPVRLALDYVHGVLLGRIEDLRERWEAVERFRRGLPGTLEHVRALSAAQLVYSGDSVANAAATLGISTKRVHALLAGQDLPTLRQVKHEPGHQLGVLLAVAELIAEQVEPPGASRGPVHQLAKLAEPLALSPAAIVSRMVTDIRRWSRSALFSPRLAALTTEFDQAVAQLSDLPQTLSAEQQGLLWIAHGKTRVRLATS